MLAATRYYYYAKDLGFVTYQEGVHHVLVGPVVDQDGVVEDLRREVLDKPFLVDESHSRQPHYCATGHVVRHWAALWFGWFVGTEGILRLSGLVGFDLSLHRDQDKLKMC